MNLWCRLLWIKFFGNKKPLEHWLGTAVLKFFILPTDLDIYGHLNNGRYLGFMDLGRYDLIRRTQLKELVQKYRWMPLVGSSVMRYRRALFFGQRVELHTRIAGWDEKWFYLEQDFVRHGHVFARGLVKGLFRSPQGNIAPQEIVEKFAPDLKAPNMPDDISAWQRMEAASSQRLRRSRHKREV